MTLYDRFVSLSIENGVSPSHAALEAGISKSLLSKWKQNPDIIPSGSVLNKVASYFNITVNDLLNDTDKDEITGHERKLISLYRKAHISDRNAIDLILNKYVQESI